MLETLELRSLSCAGCAVTIRTALDIAEFTSVKVNLLHTPHTVTAEVSDDKQLDLLKTILRDHGYPLLEDNIEIPDDLNPKFS